MDQTLAAKKPARISTRVSHAFAARYRLKPSRAIMSWDNSSVRVTLRTVDCNGAKFHGEMRREVAHGMFATLPEKTWVYLLPSAYDCA